MSDLKLYEIKKAYMDVMNLDVDEETLKMALDAVQVDIKEKANNIGYVLRTLEAEEKAYDAEIDRFKALKDSAKAKAESIKKYLAETLQDMEIPKLSTEHFKFSFRKSESVDVLDPELIPDDYKTTKTEIRISKTDIKKAIKNGESVVGARLITRQNLQIK